MKKIVKRNIFLLSFLINKNSVPVRKGSPLDVLTQETNVETFVEKRSESKSFSSCEVDYPFSSNAISPLIINFLDSRVSIEVFRDVSDSFSNFFEDIHIETSIAQFSHLRVIDERMEDCASPLADLKLFIDGISIGLGQFVVVFVP